MSFVSTNRNSLHAGANSSPASNSKHSGTSAHVVPAPVAQGLNNVITVPKERCSLTPAEIEAALAASPVRATAGWQKLRRNCCLFLYVLFPVMLCLIIGAAMFGEHFRKNTT